MAKLYSPTGPGRKQLQEEMRHWQRYTIAIDMILESGERNNIMRLPWSRAESQAQSRTHYFYQVPSERCARVMIGI